MQLLKCETEKREKNPNETTALKKKHEKNEMFIMLIPRISEYFQMKL